MSANLKKIARDVNTVMLVLTLVLIGVFYLIKTPMLIYTGVVTAVVLLIFYVLIYKEYLRTFVIALYGLLMLYMGVMTVCLGPKFGFNLYSMSMIPIIYYLVYLGQYLKKKSIKAVPMSIAIAICNIISTVKSVIDGPIYERNSDIAVAFLIFNSITVFAFLIFFTNLLIKGVFNSEDMLETLAMEDELTGLYNRHYMINKFKEVEASGKNYFVTIIDIDDFKEVNDKYGHIAGDYVLKNIAKIFNEACDGLMVCRWGGEEFLILGDDIENAYSKMNEIIKTVSKTDFIYENYIIKVTITCGITFRKEVESIDKIISAADKRLYYGKTHGKNCIVGESINVT